jgi:hypothetical protein
MSALIVNQLTPETTSDSGPHYSCFWYFFYVENGVEKAGHLHTRNPHCSDRRLTVELRDMMKTRMEKENSFCEMFYAYGPREDPCVTRMVGGLR